MYSNVKMFGVDLSRLSLGKIALKFLTDLTLCMQSCRLYYSLCSPVCTRTIYNGGITWESSDRFVKQYYVIIIYALCLHAIPVFLLAMKGFLYWNSSMCLKIKRLTSFIRRVLCFLLCSGGGGLCCYTFASCPTKVVGAQRPWFVKMYFWGSDRRRIRPLFV